LISHFYVSRDIFF